MWRWRYQTMALSNSLCGISLVLSNVNAESMFLNGCGLRTHQHSEMPWTPAYRNAVTHQHTDMPWNHITPKCRATMRSVILTVTMNSRNTTGSSAVVWPQFCLLWGGGGMRWYTKTLSIEIFNHIFKWYAARTCAYWMTLHASELCCPIEVR